MPKISTDNYDTVASWNGSQDLFVVEQPDGTKVATPNMVKQFIQAGNFEATGEIKDGHGNILKDMAKSADVNTALAGKQDTLTFDNAPTQNSNNPVKSGGIYTALATKHNTDTVEFVGNVTMASNYLGTITASSLGISDCTKYNWDIRSKSWEAFPQIANVTTSSVTFYVRWLSSASGGSVSLKNSGEVQITLTGMTRHDI